MPKFSTLELTQVDILVVGSERKLAPMTVSSPNAIEIKLDRVIDDMRFLRSQMIAFDRHLKGIEASLKPSEPSEQQPESKSRPWFAAAARAMARTVFVLFAVGAATGAALLYLGTRPHNRTAICALMSAWPGVRILFNPLGELGLRMHCSILSSSR